MQPGELKHGPISLITDGMPVIALATQQAVLPKTVSNMKEVKARGAKTLLICRESETVDADAYDFRDRSARSSRRVHALHCCHCHAADCLLQGSPERL